MCHDNLRRTDDEEASVGATFDSKLPYQSDTAKRSAFSFSLPAPIEIELESRHDTDGPIVEDEEKLPEAMPSWEGGGESKSEEVNEIDQHEEYQPHGNDLDGVAENGDGIATAAAAAVAAREESMSPPLASQPYTRDMALPALSSQNDPVFQGEQSALHQGTGAWTEYTPNSIGGAGYGNDTPKKTTPLNGEQEARWLGRSGDTTSATDVERQHSSHCETEEFRIYPHYIPIPATAEAASLPFRSGDPLLVLGSGLEKNTDGEPEMKTSGRVDQKLQFQLAIHDLSVCWRLFKGRDWAHGCTGESRNTHRKTGAADRRGHSRKMKRGSPSDASIEAKGRARGRSRENSNVSYTTNDASKPRKAELLDALLENYQDDGGRRDGDPPRCRSSRQPRVKLLNRDPGATGSIRSTGRDTSCMLEVVLQNSNLRLDSFHPESPPSVLSNMLFTIKNLYASDTLTSSRPRKTLQHWRDDLRHPREHQQKMVTVRMTARSPSDHYCPEDTPLGDELMLKVRILPIWLSFGQHTVDFLRSFSPKESTNHDLHARDRRDGETTADKDASPFFISCCDVGACKVHVGFRLVEVYS